MGFWSESDKGRTRRTPTADSDHDKNKTIELAQLDPVDLNEDLGGGPLVAHTDGQVRIFGKYTEQEITELMAWSGIFEGIRDKGYDRFHTELQYLSDMDQRIFIKEGDAILVHIRLKLSHFRFRLHPGAPQKKLLYIDWLMTRHPRSLHIRPERLFPGQDLPGLGVFAQIQDFITNLTLGVGARGAFNIPEYFHDALLFHRVFSFYDPAREVVFRALIRDLRRHGAREISRGLSEGRVINAENEVVRWTPGEMISAIDPELEELLWTPDYHTKVVRGLKRYRFTLLEQAPEEPLEPMR